MSNETSQQTPGELARPVSAFVGPIAELIGQRMLAPPSRPGVLAQADRFEVLRVLGGGGMGIVLLARDPRTQEDVAIKMVKAELLSNQQVVHRFVKEAGHLQQLRHANILPILEVSNRPQGPYFVMPYFDRGSLARRIQPGRSLEPEAMLDIASQIAEGLRYAHQHGIIHRDLKPANILLAANDRACLADFGLARTMFNDTIVDAASQQCEGTAPYMSPAVAAGEAEDTRCDIYAFGALLYEMLTGEPPYQGASTKEIQSRISAGPPQPITALNPKADRKLVAVAEGAMARELRDRYADMADVVADLQRIKQGASPVGPRGKNRQRTGQPVAKLVLMAAGIAVVAALTWMLRSKELPLPKPAPVMPVTPVPIQASFTFTTLAGQPGVSGSADGPGVQALFHLPAGIALDHAGNIYVADTANNLIRKITPEGVTTTLAGQAGNRGSADGDGGLAGFWMPFGIAVDKYGYIYVADTLNDTIRKLSPSGEVSTLAGSPGIPGSTDGTASQARFRNPWGIAVDTSGNLYVADSSNNTVRKITPAGVVTTLAGIPGKSGETDGAGPNATFNNPQGVAVENAGNVYVEDTANNSIRLIAPNGQVHTLAGVKANFRSPQGITVDGHGNIYVADSGNFTIRQITSAGTVSTVAGQPGSAAGSADGIGKEARFNYPNAVAVDDFGNLYVADTNNHTIRKGIPAKTAKISQPSGPSVTAP